MGVEGSLLRRGSKVFSGEEDPLNNGSAGTGLPVTSESAGPIRGSRFSAWSIHSTLRLPKLRIADLYDKPLSREEGEKKFSSE